MYKRNSQGWLKHMDFILWDIFALQVAFVLGYMIRHGWGKWPYLDPYYRSLAVALVALDVLISIIFNTMHNVVRRGYFKEYVASLKQAVFVLALMSLYFFSVQAGDIYSRITLYLTAVFHVHIGYIIRVLWKKLIRRLNRNKIKSAMILVADERSVGDILRKEDDLDGFEYAGLILSNRDAEGETIAGLKVVANLENAADYLCREWVDEVFVYPENLSDLRSGSIEGAEEFYADPAVSRQNGQEGAESGPSAVGRLIEQCQEMAMPVHIRLPLSSAGGKSFVEKVGGYNVLTITANYAEPIQLAIKRIMDILGGVVGSIITLFILAVVTPMIKKESPGPVLFRQVRVGRNGKRFTLYKIRSMYLDAEDRKKELMEQNRVSDGMMFKLDWDPRIIGNKIVDGKHVTGIGEKLRRSSLDEFPQFFNVLKGNMSMVGTRPPTVDEWTRYQLRHRARLAIKPGMTGMWQVSGRSSITDFEEVVRLDTEYINRWSLGLDIKILLKTIRIVLGKDGAM